MQRFIHLLLAISLVMLPEASFGAGKYDAANVSARKKKKKRPKKPNQKPAEEEQAIEAARAQGEDEESQGSRRKKKRRARADEGSAEGEGTAATESPAQSGPKETAKTDAPKTDRPTAKAAVAKNQTVDDDDDDGPVRIDFEESPSKVFELLNRAVPPRRYAYVVGAIVGGIGLVFAYQSQGEAKRAETVTSALEAQRAIANARASAALANVLYGLAGAAIVLALVLEFIPEPLAEKASLTLHF